MKINLNETVDLFGAKIFVNRNPAGEREARFDLSGLPRVDGLLIGQKVTEAPSIVEHLCGICPVPHHLAGMRALDALAGLALRKKDQLVRSLLHHSSIVEAHALRLVEIDRELALALRKFSKHALTVSGCPGHFPAVAVPGGVKFFPTAAALNEFRTTTLEAKIAAEKLSLLALNQNPNPILKSKSENSDTFADNIALPNLALIDENGNPSLIGTKARVTLSNNEVLTEFSAAQWLTAVGEENPGKSASRPYLKLLGSKAYYRVGPIAQLSIGKLATPLAAKMQAAWLKQNQSALSARAIITLHAIETIENCLQQLLQITETDALSAVKKNQPDPESTAPNTRSMQLSGTATGWIDSPRGILAHTYTADEGIITNAQIITPTAQNEPWLGKLLTAAVQQADVHQREEALEESIRSADPCLPVSSAPKGHMSLRIEEKLQPPE